MTLLLCSNIKSIKKDRGSYWKIHFSLLLGLLVWRFLSCSIEEMSNFFLLSNTSQIFKKRRCTSTTVLSKTLQPALRQIEIANQNDNEDEFPFLVS